MASRNPFLVNWVKSAYGMEMGLVSVLERQTSQVKDNPELQRGLTDHLEKTRKHVDLLKDCLQRMGENVSAVRPSDPITAAYGHPDGSQPDIAQQTQLIDYVNEAFEVASYRALGSLANLVGDRETSQVCEQILNDELVAAAILDRSLPGSPSRSIVHLEIPTGDRQVAARFYSDLFGWKYEHMGPPMNYTTFMSGTIPGGFPDFGNMYKPGDVIFYVESKDIDADLRRIESLGGKTVTPRTEIPGTGHFALFTDPAGNRVGLFSA